MVGPFQLPALTLFYGNLLRARGLQSQTAPAIHLKAIQALNGINRKRPSTGARSVQRNSGVCMNRCSSFILRSIQPNGTWPCPHKWNTNENQQVHTILGRSGRLPSKATLKPAIDQAINQGKTEQSLLQLRVCDPSCGSRLFSLLPPNTWPNLSTCSCAAKGTESRWSTTSKKTSFKHAYMVSISTPCLSTVYHIAMDRKWMILLLLSLPFILAYNVAMPC